MKYLFVKDIVRMLNNHILDYNFERVYEEINENGITRIYKNKTFFEGYVLTLKLDNNGINAKLLVDDIEMPEIFADELSMDTIKLYAMEGINLSILLDIIIDTIDEYLEDLAELKRLKERGYYNE